MFRNSIITIAIHFAFSISSAQNLGFESYYSINSMWLSSPGSLGIGLYGWENPALLTYQKNFDLLFSWQNKDNNPFNKANRFGLFAATNGLGFGWIKNKIGDVTENDYRISLVLEIKVIPLELDLDGLVGTQQSSKDRA